MKREDFSLIPGYDPYRDAGDDYYYDPEAGARVVRFFRNELKFTKGKWKGLPFDPYPAQAQRLRCTFGWRRVSDGQRRYRVVFLYIPRKNGKSEEAAGIGHYCFICEEENDHEIYVAARDRGQASTLYNMALGMRNQNPMIAQETVVVATTKELRATWDNGKMQAISSDALSQHSLSPSVAIVDEVHAQRNGDLIAALKTGMGGREQPLLILITTADLDRPSVCNEELEYAKAVRDGLIHDPRYLPIIYETDKDADPFDEQTWIAANPNYPITPNKDFMVQCSLESRHSLRKLSDFCRYNLNMKTSDLENWINMDFWRLGTKDYTEAHLHGRPCFAAVDLAYKADVASLVLLFDDGHTVCRFFVPRNAVDNDKSGKYREFVDAGYLIIAGDIRTDYDAIKEALRSFNKVYEVKAVAFDPWNASQFASDLADEGWNMIEFRQGFHSMNEPSKETEARILETRIFHNNAMLDWMAANCSVKTDPAGNIKPVKPARGASLKVDGIICIVMCVGLEMMHEEDEKCKYAEGDGAMTNLMDYL